MPIVAVHPRRLVEDELLPWVFGTGEPVMRLVTGPGGQGKTVLGRLACQAAAKEGWSAGFADLPAADWRVLAKDGALAHQTRGLRRWTQIIAALTALPALERDGRSVRLLLVVDYAENQVEPLKDLLTELTSRGPDGDVLAAQVGRCCWPAAAWAGGSSWRWTTPATIGSTRTPVTAVAHQRATAG
jgi:hypothetical protein